MDAGNQPQRLRALRGRVGQRCQPKPLRDSESGPSLSLCRRRLVRTSILCVGYVGFAIMSIFAIPMLGRRGIQSVAVATTGCWRDIYPNSASRLTNTRVVVLNGHALKQSVVTARKERLFCRCPVKRPLRALHSSHSIVRTVSSFPLPTCCPGLP